MKPLSNMETSSRRARSKSNFEKRRSIHKLSDHDKPQLSARTSTLEKNKSSKKGKATSPFRAPSIDKKPGYSQADISYSPKSSPSTEIGSQDGISEAGHSSIQKNQGSSFFCKTNPHMEFHSPADAISTDGNEKNLRGKCNMNWGEMHRKKYILSLARSTQISKKERHNANGVDRKKRSRSHKGKHAATDSNHTCIGSPLIEGSELLRKHASSKQQNSASTTKKETRMLRLSIKKHPEVIFCCILFCI